MTTTGTLLSIIETHTDAFKRGLLNQIGAATYLVTKHAAVAGLDGMIDPAVVSDSVIEAMREEKFFILPPPDVLTYMQRKTSDYDRWLRGMRRLRERKRSR